MDAYVWVQVGVVDPLIEILGTPVHDLEAVNLGAQQEAAECRTHRCRRQHNSASYGRDEWGTNSCSSVAVRT